MAVGDNTLKSDWLVQFSKNIGKFSAEPCQKVAAKKNKNHVRALELGATGMAVVFGNRKTALSTVLYGVSVHEFAMRIKRITSSEQFIDDEKRF